MIMVGILRCAQDDTSENTKDQICDYPIQHLTRDPVQSFEGD